MEIGRLAPSPTGAQHLGNARTYLIAWLSIRQKQGHLILRVEDIDSPRVKPWATQQAIDDLNWLGLDWDEGPDKPIADRKYIQSGRLPKYLDALEKLKASEAVYPCTCSRSDVEEAASAPHEISDGPVYGRTCFQNQVAQAKNMSGPLAWRFRTCDRPISFEDRLSGVRSANVERELGDFVVFKNNDSPAYQLSVVVDDHEMGITEVVRGDDLIASTFRQICLYDFFGWTLPRFHHVPLVVGTDGRRLAKRHGDTRLSHYRDHGVRPERIVGLLAYSLGWIEGLEEIKASELLPMARLDKIPSNAFTLLSDHLKWLEGG